MSQSLRPRRISDLTKAERQQLERSLVPVGKRVAIRKQVAARLDTIYSGALLTALGDAEAGDALLTILKHRMPDADAEALAVKLVGAAVGTLEKAKPSVVESLRERVLKAAPLPAVAPSGEDVPSVDADGYGADRTTETPPNANTNPAVAPTDKPDPHWSQEQPREDGGQFRQSIWQHFGNTLATVRKL